MGPADEREQRALAMLEASLSAQRSADLPDLNPADAADVLHSWLDVERETAAAHDHAQGAALQVEERGRLPRRWALALVAGWALGLAAVVVLLLTR